MRSENKTRKIPKNQKEVADNTPKNEEANVSSEANDVELLSLLKNTLAFIDITLSRGAVKGSEVTAVAILRSSIIKKAQDITGDVQW